MRGHTRHGRQMLLAVSRSRRKVEALITKEYLLCFDFTGRARLLRHASTARSATGRQLHRRRHMKGRDLATTRAAGRFATLALRRPQATLTARRATFYRHYWWRRRMRLSSSMPRPNCARLDDGFSVRHQYKWPPPEAAPQRPSPRYAVDGSRRMPSSTL